LFEEKGERRKERKTSQLKLKKEKKGYIVLPELAKIHRTTPNAY